MLTIILTMWHVSLGWTQTSNLIGTAGQFGYAAGTKGAEANRQMADRLYDQALKDEQAARQSFPPNVSLLFKALQESKDAKAADDQAKEFARAALHAANTGAHAGDFVNSRYGMQDEARLKELSTTSSPYLSRVEATLGGYGMKLSADQTKLQTPLGTFSVRAEDSTLMSLAGKIAGHFGVSASAATEGLAAARSAREGIASDVIQSLDKKRQASSGRVPASNGGEEPEATSDSEVEREPSLGQIVAEASEEARPVRSLEDEQNDLDERRRRIGLELGLGSDYTPIGRPTQDIFEMINTRYQSLLTSGQLLPR